MDPGSLEVARLPLIGGPYDGMEIHVHDADPDGDTPDDIQLLRHDVRAGYVRVFESHYQRLLGATPAHLETHIVGFVHVGTECVFPVDFEDDDDDGPPAKPRPPEIVRIRDSGCAVSATVVALAALLLYLFTC